MEEKKTLSAYLYQSLRARISTGQWPYGSSTPSMRRISEEYHVGIRTVKDVFKRLGEEGYIQTRERAVATVCYRQPDLTSDHTAIAFIVKHRTPILEAYTTMELLMPSLLAFSAQLCEVEELEHYPLALRASKKPNVKTNWRAGSALLHDLLSASGNLLFCDLYTSLELYAQIPFFFERQHAVTAYSLPDKNKPLSWTVETLQGTDPRKMEEAFAEMYHQVGKTAENALALLEKQYPGKTEAPLCPYTWDGQRGRDHYYTQITRDIIDKIGTGVYLDGSFLPPEAALAKEYGVSVSTVRKALSDLCTLGFGKTFNAKGTQVILSDDSATFRCMKNKTYKRDTLLYLSALQLLALAIRPAATLAAGRITGAEQKQLLTRFERPGTIPLDDIFHLVCKHVGLRPLQAILEEAGKLVLWGYYFSFYQDGDHSANLLNQKSLRAFRFLQEDDIQGFADGLSSCYSHILNVVRDFLVTCGLPEAAKLKSPEDRSEEAKSTGSVI